jgi:DNA-binding response OmpR family regulator
MDVLVEYFESQGHEVESADHGPAAIAAFTRAQPDVVLLDIRMPGMDGVEVLKRLRALSSTVPIIMVTANEDVALARLTVKLGAFDYVSKPFDFAYLERAVTAGLLHASKSADPGEQTGRVDPAKALLHATFRVTRGMPAAARASTGARIEDAALAAVLDGPRAHRRLEEIDVLLDLAVELGDLTREQRAALSAPLDAARTALPVQA